jgi:uncharacterized protein (TIGR02722 family)
MHRFALLLVGVGLGLVLLSCGSKPQVARVATTTVTDLSGNWNDTDARLTSGALIQDCFARPWLKKFTQDKSRAPKIRVRKIVNKTSEHIDAQVFVKNIERAMVNSGDVDVVAQGGHELDSVNDEQDMGASGRVSDESAPSIGNQEGADYVMTGRIACIADSADGKTAKLYKVTFELIDSTTARKVWIGDHEIKKMVKGRLADTCGGGEEAPAPVRAAKPRPGDVSYEQVAPAPMVTPGPGPGRQEVVDEGGRKVLFPTVRGAPAVIGCSDGEREAFADLNRWPTIAGCLASWPEHRSMRGFGTGAPCGDDLGPCAEPADACAAGWHVCGRDGNVNDLFGRVSATDCEQAAPGGIFSAGMSHCAAQQGCKYGLPVPSARAFPCFKDGWCSEPVCCGHGCGTGTCPDGVWPGKTHIAQGTDQGCARISSKRAGGVLCCKDGR